MTLPEMFDAYAKERGFGPRVVHFDGQGFALFQIHDRECYLQEIYVVPEKRRDHIASKLADKVVEIAKDHGCTMLTGSVVPSANGSEVSRKALEGYGLKLFGKDEDFEKYAKEI